MAFVIKVIGLEAGPKGRFLEDAIIDTISSNGVIAFTDDPTKARQFHTASAARQFWMTQSTTQPLRADGKPNRPLTCYGAKIYNLAELMRQPSSFASPARLDGTVIDILNSELTKKLPHWLSWQGKNPERVEAIRAKHRAKYLAARREPK